MPQKNIIITGATGMVGGHLLDICLQSDEVRKVTSVVRKPSGKKHEKLLEVVHEDFMDYSAISTHFEDQDVAFFCLGVYTGAVPRDKFREIMVDYPVNFGKLLHEKSPQAVFCLLSGAGADRSEKASMMFAKDKGAAENQLDAIGFSAFYAFRPAYIYPVEGRREPNLFYKISRILYPIVRAMGQRYSIRSTELAQAMFHVGMHGADKSVLENADIRKRVSQ